MSDENEWVPDDALENLATERTVHSEEEHEDTARRLLRENVGMAVLGIVHTARHGSTDRIRFEAQKYITERVLGKVGEDISGGGRDPLEEFLGKVEAVANEGA